MLRGKVRNERSEVNLVSVELREVTQSDGKRLRVVLLNAKIHRLQTVHVQQELRLLY